MIRFTKKFRPIRFAIMLSSIILLGVWFGAWAVFLGLVLSIDLEFK